jgi:hypothetical protein
MIFPYIEFIYATPERERFFNAKMHHVCKVIRVPNRGLYGSKKPQKKTAEKQKVVSLLPAVTIYFCSMNRFAVCVPLHPSFIM